MPDNETVTDLGLDEYKYDFVTDEKPLFKAEKGLSEELVRQISAHKDEPEWMLEFRLKALETFYSKPMPDWGGDLSTLDLDEVTPGECEEDGLELVILPDHLQERLRLEGDLPSGAEDQSPDPLAVDQVLGQGQTERGGLARTGPGDDEQRTGAVHDRDPLLLVEFIEPRRRLRLRQEPVDRPLVDHGRPEAVELRPEGARQVDVHRRRHRRRVRRSRQPRSRGQSQH